MITENLALLQCHNITKTYATKTGDLKIIKGINLKIMQGECIAITGSSGSGKTTLLNILSGLETPTSGSVLLANQPINFKKTDKIRNQKMGFVYQYHHLLAEFTAVENVAIPLLIRPHVKIANISKDAISMLKKVGLGERLQHRPSELSGGECQRVAIARALVTNPSIVFMDEPTGNLDKNSSLVIHQLINNLNKELSTTFIIVTHDLEFAKKMQHILQLSAGLLKSV